MRRFGFVVAPLLECVSIFCPSWLTACLLSFPINFEISSCIPCEICTSSSLHDLLCYLSSVILPLDLNHEERLT